MIVYLAGFVGFVRDFTISCVVGRSCVFAAVMVDVMDLIGAVVDVGIDVVADITVVGIN